MKTTRGRLLVVGFFVSRFISFCASAQTPQLINYQGRLVDGTNLVNGTVGLSLRLYNIPAGGNSIYEDSNSVTVVDGLYSTFLGDNTTSGTLAGALTNAAVYLEAVVNGTALAPRERLVSVAYALSAWSVNGNASAGTNNFVGTIDDVPLELRVGNWRFLRVSTVNYTNANFGAVNILMGSPSNQVGANAEAATISGGGRNYPGHANIINTGLGGTIGGGYANEVLSEAGTIAGGRDNKAGYTASVGGGVNNDALGFYSTVPGGLANSATGSASFAAGASAHADHNYSFVWQGHDPQFTATHSTGPGQFIVRADGGVGINTNAPVKTFHINGDIQIGRPTPWASSSDNHIINFGDEDYVYIGERGNDDLMELRAGNTPQAGKGFYFSFGNIGIGTLPTTNKIQVVGGAFCAANGTTWVNASDKNLKDGFQPVDAGDILARVSSMPVNSWFYKSEGESLRHIGPTAQDFHAAFSLGYDDTSIATVDADGIALAAIQALKRESDTKDAKIQDLQNQLDELRQRLGNLEDEKP